MSPTALGTRERSAGTREDLRPADTRPPWSRRRITILALSAGGILATVWAWNRVGLSASILTEGRSEMAALLRRMLPPHYTTVGRWTRLAVETFAMAILGTSIATAISFPLAFQAAHNTTLHPLARRAARSIITMARAIPDLVFAIIFVGAIGIGPLAGVLALGLHSVGMIGKLFADAIEEIDEVPRDAVTSTGASQIQSLATGVLPQVMPAFTSVALYRLDINVRTSVILGIVGAGGIGFELQAALRALVYDRGLAIVTVIMAMVVLVEWISALMRRSLLASDSASVSFGHGGQLTRPGLMWLRRRPLRSHLAPDAALVVAADSTAAPSSGAPHPGASTKVRPPWTMDRAKRSSYGALVVAAVGASLLSVEFSPGELFGSLPEIWEAAAALFPPDFSSATSGIIEGMTETIAIGVVATFIGALLSVPVGLLAARNVSPNRLTYLVARGFLVFVRSIPELILAVIFVAALGLGPIPGVLALSIGALGFMAKLVADGVEQVDARPREAVASTGASRLQETLTSVVPQAMPSLISSTLYMLDINIRTSTVLGIVGGGGIGFLLQNSTRVRAFETTGAIILSIFAAVFVIEQLSGWVRRQVI